MLRQPTKIVLILLWTAAIVGILHAEPLFASVFGDGHSVCGPWGCGPPLKSLLVWHGFVAVLTIPAAAWLGTSFATSSSRAAKFVLVLALAAAATFVVTNTGMWWSTASASLRGYVFQRAVFSTVAFTDAPVWPLLSAAFTFHVSSRRSMRRSQQASTTSADDS